MQKRNRTDRILIIIALVILMMAGGLLYFDSWMWGGPRDRGARVATLLGRNGDVRVKFGGDIGWQKASGGQDLLYNDSLFVGGGSSAHLVMGDSEMTVDQNTLMVIRRDNDELLLNLTYGNISGKVAKNEKVKIQTPGGKPIELVGSDDTEIRVRKVGSETQMEVVKGEADVMVKGKKTHLNPSSRLTMTGDSVQQSPSQLGTNESSEPAIEVIKPLKSDVIFSEVPSTVEFQWKLNSGRRAGTKERFEIEFSTSDQFEKLYMKRQVVGKLGDTFSVNESMSLYYRVVGPRGEISNVEKMNFVRIRPPVILKPVAQTKFVVPTGESAAVVGFEVSAFPQNSKVRLQVASDATFDKIISEDMMADTTSVRTFPAGQYFVRAETDYGSGYLSKWTSTIPFTVEPKVEELAIPVVSNSSRFLIPNEEYPSGMYAQSLGRDAGRVGGYLARQGLLRDFFPMIGDSVDELRLQLDGSGEPVRSLTKMNMGWPADKLKPGSYTYRIQGIKQGFTPSPWSAPAVLTIAMEPPRPLNAARFVGFDKAGRAQLKWHFTPLLFAKTYEVEIGTTATLSSKQTLNVKRPEVVARANQALYWRVRAMDSKRQFISDFSPIFKNELPAINPLAQQNAKPPPPPAVVPPPPPPRQPAQAATPPPAIAQSQSPSGIAATTSTRAERDFGDTFRPNGWWIWAGGGDNYVDYRQSIPGTGTIENTQVSGPSKYLEAGFTDHAGFGALVTYKETPGQFSSDLPIDKNSYDWTTWSLEAVLNRVTPYRVFGGPVIFGARLGIQQQNMPFVNLTIDNTLELKNNSTTEASAGVWAEWVRHRWTYSWLMRYQYPLSSRADGSSEFTLTPVFAFDGSLGAAYNLTRHLKAGLFWYGQWHQFNFVYSDGTVTNAGFESLFYSSVDLRLGYDF